MSAQEIIAELAKLKPDELRLVKEKLNRLNHQAAKSLNASLVAQVNL